MPQPMSVSENHGNIESGPIQTLTHQIHSIFITLSPLTVLESRTGAAVVVENIRTIFWDDCEKQMRSLGRPIDSFKVQDLSRGFFLGYFEHIHEKDKSQAQALVMKTMISQQNFLQDKFGNVGSPRKLCMMLGALKAQAKKQLQEHRKQKRHINAMLDWLNTSLFPQHTAPEPPPPVSAPAPEPPAQEIYEVEDLTLEISEESAPEPLTTADEDRRNTGFL